MSQKIAGLEPKRYEIATTKYSMDRSRKNAKNGDAANQFFLGLLLLSCGQKSEAAKWFRLSAEQRIADAQYHLGAMYLDGQGVPKSCEEGAKWFRLAAEQGDVEAQYQLGTMHKEGNGVPKNIVDAYAWTSLAASRGVEYVYDRDRMMGAMSSAEIASGK
jgi:TPR repeat protein